MNTAMVEVDRVVKRFGEQRALDGLSLTVAEGEVLGLLGPNGAGRTTAINVLTTLLRPDEGTAQVAGLDVVRDAPAVRKVIAVFGEAVGDVDGVDYIQRLAPALIISGAACGSAGAAVGLMTDLSGGVWSRLRTLPIARNTPTSVMVGAVQNLANGGPLVGPVLGAVAWAAGITAVFGALARRPLDARSLT
jgi:ABC-type taurine transport system ATPase subunit